MGTSRFLGAASDMLLCPSFKVIRRLLWGSMILGLLAVFDGSHHVASAQTGDSSETVIQILYHPRLPYYMEVIEDDGGIDVGGIVGGPAGRALRHAEVPFKWVEMPANRQLKMIQEGSSPVCGLGWFKNKEREALGRYSLPIYQDLPQVLIAREPPPARSVKELMANSDWRFGRKLGYSYGKYVDGLIETYKPEAVTTTQDVHGMARMLHGRRFDYALVSAEEVGVALLVDEQQFLVRSFGMSDLGDGNLRYLYCNKAVPADVLNRINESITVLGSISGE